MQSHGRLDLNFQAIRNESFERLLPLRLRRLVEFERFEIQDLSFTKLSMGVTFKAIQIFAIYTFDPEYSHGTCLLNGNFEKDATNKSCNSHPLIHIRIQRVSREISWCPVPRRSSVLENRRHVRREEKEKRSE